MGEWVWHYWVWLVMTAPLPFHRESLTSLKIIKKKVFVDERWSQNRNVTSLDWSKHVSCVCCVISNLWE